MVYILLLLMITFILSPCDTQVLLDQAMQRYKEGYYHDALSLYEKIKFKGPGVWHNIGNCYWHQRHFKNAFFAYKRAFNQAKLVDQLVLREQIAKSFELWTGTSELSQLSIKPFDILVTQCTPLGWQIICLVMWFVFLICIMRWRRGLFFKISSCIVFVLLLGVFYTMRFAYWRALPRGIIIQPTKLFVAPKKAVHSLRELSLGTDFVIVDSCGDWTKVNAQGSIGWVAKSDYDLL